MLAMDSIVMHFLQTSLTSPKCGLRHGVAGILSSFIPLNFVNTSDANTILSFFNFLDLLIFLFYPNDKVH